MDTGTAEAVLDSMFTIPYTCERDKLIRYCLNALDGPLRRRNGWWARPKGNVHTHPRVQRDRPQISGPTSWNLKMLANLKGGGGLLMWGDEGSKLGRFTWVIREGPKGNHKCPSTEAQGDVTDKRRHSKNQGSGDWHKEDTAEGCQQPQRKCGPARILIF